MTCLGNSESRSDAAASLSAIWPPGRSPGRADSDSDDREN